MEPGACARPKPGRYFSSLLTLIPRAISQETVGFQHAPYLQYQSMLSWGNGSGSEQDTPSWGQPSLPKQSSSCSAQPRALLSTSHWKNRGIFSTALDLKDKQQNFRAKISHSLPKGRRGTSRRPAHTSTCTFGAGEQLLGVFC